MTDTRNPEWTTAPLAEPWRRDLIASIIADHAIDLDAWSLRLVEAYGKSGTLEVSACILTLRAALDAEDQQQAALLAELCGLDRYVRLQMDSHHGDVIRTRLAALVDRMPGGVSGADGWLDLDVIAHAVQSLDTPGENTSATVRAVAVMSRSEQARLRLLAYWSGQRVGLSSTDMTSLDGDGQRLLSDWCLAVLAQ